MSLAQNDTIVALATPPGIGGLAVLRLSGPRSWDIVQTVAPLSPPALANTVHFARIYAPPTREGQTGMPSELIDEVVLTFFQSPRSYTGEDVVEVSCHGGRYAVARVLELLLAQGARLARPGEFTERAFLNGKLDLAQAEAVAALIHARTQRAGRAAARQLQGGLSEKVRTMRARLLDLLALLELELDFSDEDVEFQTQAARRATVDDLRTEMTALAATFQRGRLVREGLRVALVGAPNAGKSTLLNALAGEDRAITSPEPGTTRDVVEAHIELAGVEIILQDTAGIRAAEGAIESQGIARTRRAIEQADMVLLLLDVADPLWPAADTLALLRTRPVVLVRNKVDLIPTDQIKQRTWHAMSLQDVLAEADVSALAGTGIEALLHLLLRLTIGEDLAADAIVIAEARHHDALQTAIASLARAREQLAAPTLLASDLRDAVNALGEITGETVGEEILDRIFSQFCIGK